MYPIIIKLLLLKGYSLETINETINMHNPTDQVEFLSLYLDNEEKVILQKLGVLCTDDNTLTQWTEYIGQCKGAGVTNAQIIATLEAYVPTTQVQEVQAIQTVQEPIVQDELNMVPDEVLKEEPQVEKEPEPVYQSLQGEETVAVKEVVQEIVDLKKLDSYNFDYETKSQLDEEIKKTQTLIADSVYKLSLLKDKTKQGPYINESYLDCPSYKKMIPQILNVIVEKRKMSYQKF